MNSKAARELAKAFKDLGFVIIDIEHRRSGHLAWHLQWQGRRLRPVWTGHTPSDRRAIRNAIAFAQRLASTD